MRKDEDTDIVLLKQRAELPLPWFFGIIHALIGSDILASPRNFGAATILKTSIDFSRYLFSGPKAIQNLIHENHTSKEAYARFILALFKKKFANKIKLKPLELFDENTDIAEILEKVRKDTWIQTMDNNTSLSTYECLELRGLNLSFQLKVWIQAVKPIIDVPDPLEHGWKNAEEGMVMVPDSTTN